MKKLALVIAAAAAVALISHSEDPHPTRAAVAIATPPASRMPEAHRVTSIPTAPVLVVAGTKLDSATLADRETALVATDRRAWRLAELAPELQGDIEVRTADGAKLVVASKDAIVVRRDTGSVYFGWLNPGDGALADRERPGERIENVVELAAVAPVAPPPPATIAMVVAGKQVRTITPTTFAGAATVTFKDKHDPAMPAIALDHLTSFESGGVHVAAEPPAPGARAVIYMNHRQRFKLAWIDPSGAQIGTKHGEVTQVALAR